MIVFSNFNFLSRGNDADAEVLESFVAESEEANFVRAGGRRRRKNGGKRVSFIIIMASKRNGFLSATQSVDPSVGPIFQVYGIIESRHAN